MTKPVLDASALLALLNAEPGSEVVAVTLPGALISAVNMSEVIARLTDSGMPESTIREIISPLGLEIIPFDEEQAYQASVLRAATRAAGISLGDRACLSLGKGLGREILTADKTWTTFSIGAKVKVIR